MANTINGSPRGGSPTPSTASCVPSIFSCNSARTDQPLNTKRGMLALAATAALVAAAALGVIHYAHLQAAYVVPTAGISGTLLASGVYGLASAPTNHVAKQVFKPEPPKQEVVYDGL